MGLSCLIEFDNLRSDSYWAGQVVNGTVTVTTDKLVQANAFSLKIKGCAHTSWDEDSGLGDNKSTTTYTGHVDYIKIKTLLFDHSKSYTSNDTGKPVIIKPGVHRYPFICHIPPECPSSMEGTYGYIRYWVQVTLKRAWKFDKNFIKCFNVASVNDLNLNGDLKLPVKSDITKHFCCGPCKSDALEINVHLPQTGYVPGQLIPINVFVKNNTMSGINEICARLVMVIVYFSTSAAESTSQTKTIAKLIGDPVLRNCKKNFNYLLPIPATPPTCLTQCSIIQITYRVEVEAKMQHIFYRNQCIQTPVTIGNVPLQLEGMVVQEQPVPRQLSLEDVEKSAGTIVNGHGSTVRNENKDPWSAIGNISAPVYMEATHMPKGKVAEDTGHEYGEQQFTPKYPVFNVSTPTSLLPTNGDEVDAHAASSITTDPNRTTWL